MRRIVKILEVRDTREFVEDGDDRWVPIPGSGTTSECARCGRDHEVHATVLLDDDTTAVVGTGCMAASGMDRGVGRRVANAAKRVGALRAEIASLTALVGELRAAEARVDAMACPEPRIAGPSPWSEGVRIVCGDAEVFTLRPTTTVEPERRQCAINDWRDKRLAELGITWHHRSALLELPVVTEKFEDTQERLADIATAATAS